MSPDNKELVLRHLNLAWNQGAFDEISNFLAADFHYKTTFTDEILDAPRYIEFIQVFREAMPNLVLEVELAMAEGQHVMTQVSFFGKRIISLDTLIDIAGLERQLGIQVMPFRPLKARLS
jgi:predicted ester cyclase